MAIITKNKLVRDLVPQYIEKKGQKPLLEVLDDKKFSEELLKKLAEETKEVIEAVEEGKVRLTEEMADMYEVIDALARLNDITKDEILDVQKQKVVSNGGFEKRLYLVSVDDNS